MVTGRALGTGECRLALAKARAALDAVRADGSNGAHNYELAKSILEDALGSLVSK